MYDTFAAGLEMMNFVFYKVTCIKNHIEPHKFQHIYSKTKGFLKPSNCYIFCLISFTKITKIYDFYSMGCLIVFVHKYLCTLDLVLVYFVEINVN